MRDQYYLLFHFVPIQHQCCSNKATESFHSSIMLVQQHFLFSSEQMPCKSPKEENDKVEEKDVFIKKLDIQKTPTSVILPLVTVPR